MGYSGIELTLHPGVNGINLGISSELKDWKLREVKEIDLQFGKYRSESNITGSFNLGTKKGEIIFPKKF